MNAPPELAKFERWPRRLILMVALVVVLGGGGVAVYLGSRPALVPPVVSLEGIDPDVASAITLARTKVEDAPHSAEAWGFLAKVLLANGLASEAEVCLRQTEKLDGNNPRWSYYRALAISETDTDGAIAGFRRAIEVCDRFEPEITAPRMQLASLLIQEGRNEEAEGVLEILRAKEPDAPQTIYLSALLLANRNDLSGAAALLRRLTENVTTRQKACTKLAQLHLRLGDAKSARGWDKMARSLPDDAVFTDPFAAELRKFWVGREQRFAEVARLQKKHRYSEAVASLEAMVANNEKGVARAYVALGENLVHLGRGPEAETAFQNALRLEPDDAETFNRLALVRFFQGEIHEHRHGSREEAKAYYERALDSVRQALRITPSLGEAHLTMGQIQFALGRRKEGIEALRLCLRSRPALSQAHLLLGKALAEDGQPDEARRHLRDALRFADENDLPAKQALELFEKKYGKERVAPDPDVGADS